MNDGRRDATTWLTRDEIRALTRASNLAGARSVLTTWALIAAAFALLAHFPHHVAAWVVALVVLGGRQLALAILMHECAHHSLFASPRLNEQLGTWLCAAPVWQRLGDYRAHHARHHAFTSLEADPDLGLTAPFPTSRLALARKFARDLSGLAFARRVVALLAMDAGWLSYTASTGARWLPHPSARQTLRNLGRNLGPVVLTQAVLLLVLASTGNAWLYAVWGLAWATTFSLFVRIRSIAEHAVTTPGHDPLGHTRTTRANLLARLTVAPHHVNLHLEHHLLPSVPHYRLTQLQRLLRERGAYAEATVAAGYLEVLRQAVARPAPTPADVEG
jgi:fatty acid desaturase